MITVWRAEKDSRSWANNTLRSRSVAVGTVVAWPRLAIRAKKRIAPAFLINIFLINVESTIAGYIFRICFCNCISLAAGIGKRERAACNRVMRDERGGIDNHDSRGCRRDKVLGTI